MTASTSTVKFPRIVVAVYIRLVPTLTAEDRRCQSSTFAPI